jgi:hypothetical protein
LRRLTLSRRGIDPAKSEQLNKAMANESMKLEVPPEERYWQEYTKKQSSQPKQVVVEALIDRQPFAAWVRPGLTLVLGCRAADTEESSSSGKPTARAAVSLNKTTIPFFR